MTVTVTKIYTDVQVDDEHTIIFPPTVQGSIRPGSLDLLERVQFIKWGDNMLGEIEPGVIPKKCVGLMLPAGYARSITGDLDKMRLLYVHHSQIATVISGRVFTIWRDPSEPEPVLPAGYNSGTWIESSNFKGYLVRDIKKLAVIAPEPVVVSLSESVPVPFVFSPKGFDSLLAKSKIESETCETYANKMAITINEEINRAADEGRLNGQFLFMFKCAAPQDKTVEALNGIFGSRLTIAKSPYARKMVSVVIRKD